MKCVIFLTAKFLHWSFIANKEKQSYQTWHVKTLVFARLVGTVGGAATFAVRHIENEALSNQALKWPVRGGCLGTRLVMSH